MLGVREPETYGSQTLDDIAELCRRKAGELGFEVDFRQTNSEGELVTWVQQGRGTTSGLVLNAGAYTHTSVALYDALAMYDMPIVEVHLSNIHKREPFRHRSYVSPQAAGVICGFGSAGYLMALDGLAGMLAKQAA